MNWMTSLKQKLSHNKSLCENLNFTTAPDSKDDELRDLISNCMGLAIECDSYNSLFYQFYHNNKGTLIEYKSDAYNEYLLIQRNHSVYKKFNREILENKPNDLMTLFTPEVYKLLLNDLEEIFNR